MSAIRQPPPRLLSSPPEPASEPSAEPSPEASRPLKRGFQPSAEASGPVSEDVHPSAEASRPPSELLRPSAEASAQGALSPPPRPGGLPLSAEALGLAAEDREAAPAARFADFVALVARLRRDCPWDREQTHASVRHLTIEEAFEVAESIDQGDAEGLKNELGDLLLHVLFHAHIAEGEGTFALADVIEGQMAKLVRRHPHVFGEAAASGTAEVLRNWEAIKRAERSGEASAEARSALAGVPPALPALLRAERVQEKAAAVGFDFPDGAGAWAKVREEIAELEAVAAAGGDADRLEDELGDVLFALVNHARFVGVVPENALRRTVAKFERRFRHVEARLGEGGRGPSEASLEEMDALWDEAKASERPGPRSGGLTATLAEASRPAEASADEGVRPATTSPAATSPEGTAR